MLGKFRSPGALSFALADTLLVLMLGVLAGAAFLWNHEWVFFGGEVFFVDGDCYARMTRVRLLEQDPFVPLRTHGFENFPQGTVPHTTIPLDAMILGLRWIFAPMGSAALSMAGALVSPILGLLALLFLAWWASRLELPFRWPALIVFAISPMTAQAFLLGRPDHQSLVVLLMAVALGAETAMWLGRKHVGWRYAAAAAWALALWTSLFEPLVILAVVVGLRGIRRLFFGATDPDVRRSFGPLGVFCGILVLAFLWDGWRMGGLDPHFRKWAATIGELRGASPSVLFAWCGWLLPVVIVLLGWNAFRGRLPTALLWLGLLVAVTGLTLWHARWGYLLVLIFAMSLPAALVAIRPVAVAFGMFAISLLPIASEWDTVVFPNDQVFRSRAENFADSVAVRDAARVLRSRPPGAVLAPWWLSPPIVWWSGLPAVGGTSHQSLPGIVDSARFYVSGSEAGASEILRGRRVRYVVGYDPDRLVQNSAQILGMPPPAESMAGRLFAREIPAGLELIYGNRLVRVFEARSTNLQDEDELAVSPLWPPDVKRGTAGEADRRRED